jgi:FixJ family two-component response regulator
MASEGFATNNSPQIESPTILLVEDETRVRKVMAEVLSAEGYSVLDFATAEHALAHPYLSLSKMTVLITDVMLPGKTGRQLASDLRDRLPEIKTILVSGYGESVALLGTEKSEAVSYLPKPFSATSLLAAVRKMVRSAPNSRRKLG